MLIVFVLQDFGDGGAFPEIHVAQYPYVYFFFCLREHNKQCFG